MVNNTMDYVAHTAAEVLLDTLKESMVKVKIGGSYYHYKDPHKYYKVLNIGLFESNEKVAVIYTDEILIWIRDLDIWCEKVDHNGILVDRFTELLQ